MANDTNNADNRPKKSIWDDYERFRERRRRLLMKTVGAQLDMLAEHDEAEASDQAPEGNVVVSDDDVATSKPRKKKSIWDDYDRFKERDRRVMLQTVGIQLEELARYEAELASDDVFCPGAEEGAERKPDPTLGLMHALAARNEALLAETDDSVPCPQPKNDDRDSS